MIATRIGDALLAHDDCLNWHRTRKPLSIHAVVTDPPYGIAHSAPGRHRGSVHARSRTAPEKYLAGKYTNCAIMGVIELGSAPKHFVVAEVVE